MNTHAKALKPVLSIAVTALLGATAVVVAQNATLVSSVSVCVKSNGQLRVLTGANTTCDSSEQRTDWVVGDELANITLGQGLTGSREGGVLQLAIDPALLERGRIFSGFNDGPGEIPNDLATIATLNLPAGSYAIFAKLTLDNTFSGTDRIVCRLSAETDFDDAGLVVEDAVLPLIGYLDTLNLNVVHHFTDPGAVTLACATLDVDHSTRYRYLKITAVEGSSISNVFLAAP
jgi:hypothetical protein